MCYQLLWRMLRRVVRWGWAIGLWEKPVVLVFFQILRWRQRSRKLLWFWDSTISVSWWTELRSSSTWWKIPPFVNVLECSIYRTLLPYHSPSLLCLSIYLVDMSVHGPDQWIRIFRLNEKKIYPNYPVLCTQWQNGYDRRKDCVIRYFCWSPEKRIVH